MKKLCIHLLILLVPAHLFAQTIDYKIGAILPLTGEAASYGNASKNGIELARENLPPEERAHISVIFEDDAQKPVRAVAALKKLIDIDHVNAVVCIISNTCLALAATAESKKVVLIAIASDAQISKGKNFAFNLWVAPEIETQTLISEVEKRGYKKIAIVSTISDGAFVLKNSLKRAAQGKVEVGLEEEYEGSVKDFRSFFIKLKQQDIGAVGLVLMPGQVGLFARQLREAGSTIPIFGYEMLEDDVEVKIAQGALMNAWFVTAAAPTDSFIENYRKRFPNASLVTAPNSYDALSMLAEASRSGADPSNVSSYIKALKNFKGASGEFSSLGDGTFSLPGTLKVITEKGFENLSQ